MAKEVRLNIRLSPRINGWLEKESEETLIPKSTLILLAVEQYIQQREVVARMSDIGELASMVARIEEKLDIQNDE